jgi:hypothetical protein
MKIALVLGVGLSIGVLGTGLTNSLIINKLTRIIRHKIGLNASFRRAKETFKDNCFYQINIIR